MKKRMDLSTVFNSDRTSSSSISPLVILFRDDFPIHGREREELLFLKIRVCHIFLFSSLSCGIHQKPLLSQLTQSSSSRKPFPTKGKAKHTWSSGQVRWRFLRGYTPVFGTHDDSCPTCGVKGGGTSLGFPAQIRNENAKYGRIRWW